MIEQLGGRKFVGFLIIALLLVILVVVNKIDAQEFVTFITLNFATFTAGNVGESLTKK